MLLYQKPCIPCQGDATPFTETQAIAMKQQIHQAWILTGNATCLERQFRFKNFRDAMDLAVEIGDIAEAENHHPDLHVGWGRLTVSITTHKIHGLVESDFIFAAKVDNAFEKSR